MCPRTPFFAVWLGVSSCLKQYELSVGVSQFVVSKSNGLEFCKQNGQRFESLQENISQCGDSGVIQSKTMFINFYKL
jgi:hypothetical protein